MKKNDIAFSIPNKYIFFLAAYFILMEPRYFYYVSGIKQIFRLLIFITCAVLFCIYVFWWKYPKRSKITVMVIMYYTYLICLTVLRHGPIKNILLESMIFMGMTILTEWVIRSDPRFLFTGLLNLLVFEVFINFLTIIFFPHGLYSTEYFSNNYFLGYDNQNINILFPALVLAITKYKYGMKNASFTLAVTMFLVLFTVLVIFSGASLVIITLTLLLSVPAICDTVWLFNSKNYLIANVIIFFGIVIARLQNLLSFIIVDILGKDLTFTGRIYIWNRVEHFIIKNPIFGYGLESQDYRSSKMKIKVFYPQASNSLNSFAGLHAHNRYLETAYQGGIILTVLYALILITTAKGASKNKETVISKMVAVAMFVYLTGMLSEFYRYSYLFFPLLLMGEMATEIDKKLSIKSLNVSALLSAIGLRK